MLPILNSYLRGNDTYRSGICPDTQCKSHIVFTSTDFQVQCVACGQRHQSKNLLNVEDLDSNNAFRAMRSKLHTQKPIELIKVNGISNFQCVLVSPLLSNYGMNRGGQAELLGKDRVVDQSDILDCAKLFSTRAFLIEPDHIEISGYGRDPHGSQYLKDTLCMLHEANEGEERLVPLYADGDGHCLVHAVSKCLMGREMFWHPLRLNLVNHLHTSLEMYKAALKDFVAEDEHEWDAIIQEASPEYAPPDDQTSGLRNIHIFALSNILRRPIILLDRMTHISNAGDYAATFLPAFVDPLLCTDTATGELNKPIVIAWNSRAHNHFIPLVGIKNRPLPIISRDLLPKVWGVDQNLLDKYILFEDTMCVIGGKKCMPDAAILKLFTAMERLFFQKYTVSTGLVSEFNSCMKRNMYFGATTNDQKWMRDSTSQLIQEGKLFRCLNCKSLNISDDSSKTADLLKKFIDPSSLNTIVACEVCPFNSPCRLVSADGSTIYQNGDRTTTPSQGSKCSCGFKHYWDGKEYDNVPIEVPIRLEFNQRQVDTKVAWFQDDSNPSLNSNAYEIAGKIVNEFFPGDFGSESIIRGVVDMLIKRVNYVNSQMQRNSVKKEEPTLNNPYMEDTAVVPQAVSIPTKLTATGFSKQTFHKEQLGVNEDERNLLDRIHENAPLQQSKATNLANSKKVATKNSQSPSKSPITETVATPNKPKPAVKKTFKLTYKQEGSPARHVVQEITNELTFGTLVGLAQEEFGISDDKQRFKMGFPPKPIKMSPDEPLKVSSGDSIIVEKIESAPAPAYTFQSRPLYEPTPKRPTREAPVTQPSWKKASPPSRATDSNTSNGIRSEGRFNLYDSVADNREHFQRGGFYYNAFMELFESEPSDNHHFQFHLMPGKVFSYSKQADEFVLCLDGVHIYVQPITEELLESIEKKKREAMGNWDGESSSSLNHTFSGAIRSLPKIEAFGGAGTRLGGGDEETMHVQPYNILQDPLFQSMLSLANSSNVSTRLSLPTQTKEEDPDSIVHSKYTDDDDMYTSD